MENDISKLANKAVQDESVREQVCDEIKKGLNDSARNEIALNESGLLTPKTASEEWRVADLMLKSRALPKQFENVPQVIMAMQFLKQHNLPTLVAIRQTTIINGCLSIWGELPLGLVVRTGGLMRFQEWVFDKEYRPICWDNKNLEAEIYGAFCLLERKGLEGNFEGSFLVSEAKRANLWDKSIWKLYPRRMLQMRARSLALKNGFPDILSGISIAEYDHDVLPGVTGDVVDSGAETELNQKYLRKPDVVESTEQH